MGRNVLVTGGAGFIGSHVVDAYLAAGDTVTVVDDLSTGRRAHVPAAATLIEADVRSEPVREAIARGGFEIVNHHAAQIDVRRSVADPVFDASVNLLGLLNVLQGAQAGGVRRVVFASSGGTVYGEAAAPPLDETTPKFPASPYGTAKLAAEYYLAAFARLYGREVVALRYSNVYGPRQDGHGEAGVVAIFARQVLEGEPLTVFGDGEQTRDMVFAHDVAAANLAASNASLPALSDLDACAFNIATGLETSVNQLVAAITRAGMTAEGGKGGKPTSQVRYAPARPGELRRNALAVDKAALVLGWRPRTTLADGLRLTIHALAED
ncbi:MAG TPA: NAD-dependent epimerase/dehydratase family protein [Gemmatimonadales bacterium]|nr:NAD-dependent epimerase/dehydratase family protein [Gemmatimonadales bacterium]